MSMENGIWPILVYIAVLVVGVWLVFGLILALFQSRFVYFPQKRLASTPKDIGISFDEVLLTTEDSVKIHGWWVPATGAKHTILFCHGNAGNISDCLSFVQMFHNLDLNLLIFDYRGFGRSEGRPSEEGTYRDAEAAWKFLRDEKQIAAETIVIFGKSLGAAIASRQCTAPAPGALILESGFTSINDIARIRYPFLPVRLLSRFGYNTAENVKGAKCPVMVIHSRDDEMIPFQMGQQLFENAPEPKEFYEISGQHNDLFLPSRDEYRSRVGGFIHSNVRAD